MATRSVLSGLRVMRLLQGQVGTSSPDGDVAKVYRRGASAQTYPTAALLFRHAPDLSK